MSKTNIEWTDNSWNPLHGCSKAGPECDNCYAESFAKRLSGTKVKGYEKDDPFKVVLCPERLDEPKAIKKPSMIFVVSMGDLFHQEVPFEYIEKVLQVIKDCPQHIFQILTKRPHRMAWAFGVIEKRTGMLMKDYMPNLWAGTSVGSVHGIPRLVQMQRINTAVKFVSFEPLIQNLGNIKEFMKGLDWIIIGGETGTKHRDLEGEWVENILKCKEENTPWFFKQWNTKKKNKWQGEIVNQYPKALEIHREKFNEENNDFDFGETRGSDSGNSCLGSDTDSEPSEAGEELASGLQGDDTEERNKELPECESERGTEGKEEEEESSKDSEKE